MRLITAMLVLLLVSCFGSLLADAQQPIVPRVGGLAGGSPPAFQHITEAFLQGMQEHGYIVLHPGATGRPFGPSPLRRQEGDYEPHE